MINEIIDKLTNLLGPIATLSKDRRELKDSALRAISVALNETYFYYRDLKKGSNRSIDRENSLAKYWSAAAIPLRHIDTDLANVCEHKSEFWINPDNYENEEIERLGIGLNSVRQAYRKMLLR
jgi:hypothetical protein